MEQWIEVCDNASAMFKYDCVRAATKKDGHIEYLVITRGTAHTAKHGDTLHQYDNGEWELIKKK